MKSGISYHFEQELVDFLDRISKKIIVLIASCGGGFLLLVKGFCIRLSKKGQGLVEKLPELVNISDNQTFTKFVRFFQPDVLKGFFVCVLVAPFSYLLVHFKPNH